MALFGSAQEPVAHSTKADVHLGAFSQWSNTTVFVKFNLACGG